MPGTEDLQENHREVILSVASGSPVLSPSKSPVGLSLKQMAQNPASAWPSGPGCRESTCAGSTVGSSPPVLAATDCWDPAWVGPSLDAIGLSETG